MAVDRPAAGAGAPTVKWDESNMRNTYANVVHATGTREEVSVIFGMHHAWRPDVREVTVEVLDRVVLSPYAAKRLHLLLTEVIKQYEARWGPLPIETTATPVAHEIVRGTGGI
jgi:hypothetical protein